MTALKSKHAQQNIQMDQKAMTDVFVTERERERLRCGFRSDTNLQRTHGRRRFGSYLNIQRKYWIWGSDRCPSHTLLHAALMKEKNRRKELLFYCSALRRTTNREQTHNFDIITDARGDAFWPITAKNEKKSIMRNGVKHEERVMLGKKMKDDDDDDGFQ